MSWQTKSLFNYFGTNRRIRNTVIEIVGKLQNNTSTGYIDICIVLFKEAKFLIACYLADSFNECLKTGHYPDFLKIAKVIPLH